MLAADNFLQETARTASPVLINRARANKFRKSHHKSPRTGPRVRPAAGRGLAQADADAAASIPAMRREDGEGIASVFRTRLLAFVNYPNVS
jgi:hypothetical protein